VELLQAGYQVVVVDNFSNSKPESLKRIQMIANKSLVSYSVDICDRPGLQAVFDQHAIDAVIHLAGLKAVGESCAIPLKYYQNNIVGTLVLAEVMSAASVNKIVFSSSATVYGIPESVPITEAFPLSATNPYGRSKLMIEEILRDWVEASMANPEAENIRVVLLRYFNPIGAHEGGQIGEDPNDIPNNLLPYVAQVAAGKLETLSVFGDDYPTPDGTGVRDYIHVVDLAKGHIKALQALDSHLFEQQPCRVYNLGTGKGFSVIEIIKLFEKVADRPIPYKIVPRRAGDIAECYADPKLAAAELDWCAEKTLADMITDTWRWQYNNPNGYD
jgi:UDP-glucose 4-epimerase